MSAAIKEVVMAQAGSLTGKAALLTGSTRNLGLAIAGQLAAAGADIMLNYHHPAPKAEADEAAAAVAAASKKAGG